LIWTSVEMRSTRSRSARNRGWTAPVRSTDAGHLNPSQRGPRARRPCSRVQRLRRKGWRPERKTCVGRKGDPWMYSFPTAMTRHGVRLLPATHDESETIESGFHSGENRSETNLTTDSRRFHYRRKPVRARKRGGRIVAGVPRGSAARVCRPVPRH